MEKKIVYIDMDNVLVDFPSAFERVDSTILQEYRGREDDIPGIFSLMEPMDGAVEAFLALSTYADVYILSTAPWKNPSAWSDKLEWVKKHLGRQAEKRLILTHHKNLNRGDILIDDRKNNGAEEFQGTWIHFGSDQFPDWKTVLPHVLGLIGPTPKA